VRTRIVRNAPLIDHRREEIMSLSSLERGLDVLSAVAARGELSIEQLADELDLPLSTTYRYVRALREWGFVDGDDSRYIAGARLVELGGRHFTTSHLADVGTALLRQLMHDTGETAVMIVRVGDHAMCLRRVEPDKSIKYTFAVNQLLPLHAGAGQRVLLAWAPSATIARVLDGELERFTPDTPTANDLRRMIPDLRETGWAVSRGELDAGSVSVAVPVFFNGEVVCSLNVAGPESRCGKDWVARTAGHLRTAAVLLTESLDSWFAVSPDRRTEHA
jgi:DNA-binding IclR family transcriptional regulator